jgi:hypothetical protein
MVWFLQFQFLLRTLWFEAPILCTEFAPKNVCT